MRILQAVHYQLHVASSAQHVLCLIGWHDDDGQRLLDEDLKEVLVVGKTRICQNNEKATFTRTTTTTFPCRKGWVFLIVHFLVKG